MAAKQFEGESKKGDFQEALANAIQLAKQNLATDHVEWEIEKIHGEEGGFVLVNILKVVINAKATTKKK